MWMDILTYVEGCDKCQISTTHCKKASNLLNPNEIPTRPWQIISVDIIGELPEIQGFNAIFIVVNHFSKQIHTILINMSLTAEGYTWIFSLNFTGCLKRLLAIEDPNLYPNSSNLCIRCWKSLETHQLPITHRQMVKQKE